MLSCPPEEEEGMRFVLDHRMIEDSSRMTYGAIRKVQARHDRDRTANP